MVISASFSLVTQQEDENLTFSENIVAGRKIIVATYRGIKGAARVFSRGEDDAKLRAEQQARELWEATQ